MTMQIELFRDDYRLRERLSDKARNIRIEVRPGREVVLIYPRWVARAQALAFLRSREDWVRDKLAELARRDADNPPPPAARWDGSDEILLRGEAVPVCVEPASLRQCTVRFEPQAVTLFAPPALRDDPSRLEQALRRALMHQAQLDARRYLDEESARLGLRYSTLKLNDPQTLWGSCNPGGVICLSWRLVMAPPVVFRYVAVHELCHLRHADHSDRFWGLVERQMPDYAQHRRWLQDRGQRLHHYLPRRRGSG
ncbi:MAG TPA: SprT family zinc-dependent metalloprotease [Solimonas sp.]|nr:SprT family zinc-dependent metalloprotease [Solimonas sp.]